MDWTNNIQLLPGEEFPSVSSLYAKLRPWFHILFIFNRHECDINLLIYFPARKWKTILPSPKCDRYAARPRTGASDAPLQIRLTPPHVLCTLMVFVPQWKHMNDSMVLLLYCIFFLLCPWSTVFTASIPPALLRGLRPSQDSGAIQWVLPFNPLQCA